jgi:hypothetical protein
MQESGKDRMRVVTGACGSVREEGSERERERERGREEEREEEVFPIERKKRGGKSGGAEESVAGAN